MTPTTSTRARSRPANIDRDELATFLDTLATTLAQESSHNAGTTGDGTIAVVRGERLEGGEVRYATINATPMKDRRRMFGSAVFGVLFGASLFFIELVYGWLPNTRKVMNEDDYEALAAEDVGMTRFR